MSRLAFGAFLGEGIFEELIEASVDPAIDAFAADDAIGPAVLAVLEGVRAP